MKWCEMGGAGGRVLGVAAQGPLLPCATRADAWEFIRPYSPSDSGLQRVVCGSSGKNKNRYNNNIKRYEII